MKRQQYLTRRIATLASLSDAVGAMRSLSAHHFRLARQALAPARAYRDTMQQIIAEVGVRQPLHKDAPAGMLVVSSDMGLCGDYNSRLADLIAVEATRRAVGPVYCVGRRLRPALARGSITASRNYNAPASLDGLSQILLEMAQDLLEDYMAAQIGSLWVVSARFDGVGLFTPITTRVLPVEPVTATMPLRRSPDVDPARLTAVAVREFLYITLFEILLDAMAAEQGMRLMATESALEWLDDTHDVTRRRLATVRSEVATQELLDIVAGRGKSREPT